VAKRKRTKRSLLDSEWAKPIEAAIFLLLLWGAIEVGLVGWLIDIPMSILREGYSPKK
jgi:hypothetical protein